MADVESNDTFLSRWSRRKALARVETRDPEVAEPDTDASGAEPAQGACTIESPSDAQPVGSLLQDQVEATPDQPPLTLADVAQLTRESDFSRFVASTVQPDVKNAAMKKLFSDPHFNVMDGLDVYIDDYGKADPLPEGMLLKMAQAKFLGLLKDEAEEILAECLVPMNHGTMAVEPENAATLEGSTAAPLDTIASDENADLQLQPHDAPGRPDVGSRTGEDGGCEL